MTRTHHPGRGFALAVTAAVTSLLFSASAFAATPALSTNASSTTIGSNGTASIRDAAFLSGGTADATGTLVFRLYADPSCTSLIATGTVSVNGADGKLYQSPAITVFNAGSYFWSASYSGDANNTPIAPGCGDPSERSVVNPRAPFISTNAGGPYTLGSNGTVALQDVAMLSGGTTGAAGTLVFRLYSDSSCTSLIATRVVSVSGADSQMYASGNAIVSAPGTYHWTASYSGDANNRATLGSCGAQDENPVVNANTVDHASNPNAAPGEAVSTNTTTSAADPVGTTVTSPAGGSIDIAETQNVTTDPPSGITFLGWQVNITIPDGSPGSASNPLPASTPLRIVFHIDSSLAPSGVLLYRDGVPFPNPPDCLAAGTANPEPCIESTTPTATGVDVTVLAVHASGWNFSPADTTAPLISLVTPADGARYVLGQSVVASYSCTDPQSDVLTCAGTLANGASIPTGASALGAHTFTVNASSRGGSSSASHDYKVVFAFTGFAPPIDAQPSLNTVKPGSGVPVKFQLRDAAGASAYDQVGLNVFAPDYPRSNAIDCDSQAPLDPIEETATLAKSALVYDAKAGQYIYNWKTDDGWARGTCRRLQVKLTDGETYSADFKFR